MSACFLYFFSYHVSIFIPVLFRSLFIFDILFKISYLRLFLFFLFFHLLICLSLGVSMFSVHCVGGIGFIFIVFLNDVLNKLAVYIHC